MASIRILFFDISDDFPRGSLGVGAKDAFIAGARFIIQIQGELSATDSIPLRTRIDPDGRGFRLECNPPKHRRCGGNIARRGTFH